MSAEKMIKKAVEQGLVERVFSFPCDDYFTPVNFNHYFYLNGGYSKTFHANSITTVDGLQIINAETGDIIL